MKRLARCAALGLGAAILTSASLDSARAADETTYYTGPELGRRLLRNLVRIRALDLSEHGFGLVVGTDARDAYVLTARHVVARRPMAGLEGAEQPSRQIEIGFCAQPPTAAPQPAEMVAGFDGAADDLALLRTPLPAGYAPEPRALAASPPRELPGDAAWQLGRDDDCTLLPTPGRIANLPDASHLLRIDLANVLGGSSGGAVVSGDGIVGIVKRSDTLKITVHAIADARARIESVGGVPFTLRGARNYAPGDPQATVAELTETLTAYLFAARDLQRLLGQDVVPRSTFAQMVERYSRSVDRYMAGAEKHNGTLLAHWNQDVMLQWQQLRAEVWKVHRVFYELNGTAAKTITRTEHSPSAVKAQMAALEPALATLQSGMSRFADALARKGASHVSPSN